MKVLYFAILTVIDSSLGILKKINGQAQCLIENNVDIEVIIFYRDKSKFIDFNNFSKYFSFVKYDYHGLKRIPQLFRLWRMVDNVINKNKYDIVYFRYYGSSYFTFQLLKNNPNKIIFEHNTNELFEFKINSNWPTFVLWNEIYFAKKSFKYLLGNVGKSSDFSRHQEVKVGYKLNLKTITNGVVVSNIVKLNKFDKNATNIISLIFVGNIAMWHGLERLFKGIKNNKSSIKYKLYLVGNEDVFLKQINQYNLSHLLNKNIFITGFKSGDELNELFNKSHFAIGSLGLHRLKIVNGVPLKHREYLSRGIPFIYSGIDEDINEEVNLFLFNVEPDETAVNFDNLLLFISNEIMNKEHISSDLIKYAFYTVDMKIKMIELKSFFVERIKSKKLYEVN